MPYFMPICFFDPPYVIDASVTPIPGSGSLPLQIIANSGINIGAGIAFADTTGDYIGVYIGAIGVETLVCIIGNGVSNVAFGKFPPNSRVSLRSLVAASITQGRLTGNLVTI